MFQRALCSWMGLFHRTIDIDCTGPTLPDGVTIAPAGDKGLGLFATRPFAPARLVYRYGVRLASLKMRLHLVTDHGTRTTTPRKHGTGPVEINDLLDLRPDMLRELADVLGVDMPARSEAAVRKLWRVMTSGGRRIYMVSGFDAFINHAGEPNCVYGTDPCGFEMRDGCLTGWYKLFSVDHIQAGEELTVNYLTLRLPP